MDKDNDLEKIRRHEDSSYKVLLLEKYIEEQQSTLEQLQEENKELKHWKKRMIEYLSDWFNKTEYLSVLYKINEIRMEIGIDSDE